jgi:hypothetical protein
MSRLLVGINLSVAVGLAMAVSLCDGYSNESTETRAPLEKGNSAETANVTAARLHELADAMPDGRDVTSWYKKARTISDVKLANAYVGGEIAKAGTVESALGQFRGELMRSCEAVSRLIFHSSERSRPGCNPCRRFFSKLKSELGKSVELMRRNANSEKPGIVAFKSRHDVRQYEAAVIEFAGLQVNAQEIEKGIAALAVNIPKAADGCGSTIIPPLFSQPNVAAPKSVPRRTPLNVGPALPRRLSSVGNTNFAGPRSW